MGESEVQNVEPPKTECLIGTRHVIVFLMFLGTTVSYATRVSMSVGIVAMTSNNSYGYPVFDWDRNVQDTILSSFFWGYVVLQIPAGMLTGRYGGKYFSFVAMAITGVVNLLVPLAAVQGGWIAVCCCRVIMGLTQGLLYPSLHGILGHWAPISERSRLGTFVYAGSQLGTVIELLISGVLSASRFGWPSVFYTAGILCLIWSTIWLIVGASTPNDSRWISKKERKYIEMNTKSEEHVPSKTPTPWKGILTSLPFWAILLAHCGQNLGFWTLLTELPSYMKNVLHVNIKDNGILSALPYIAMYIVSLIASWISDFLFNRKLLKTKTSRRIFNSIAFWGPAIALLGLSYLPPGNLSLAVILLTITVGLNGAHYAGFMLSHLDLSPNHGSTLMGITNGMSAFFSILAPLTVSFVVRNQEEATEWRKVFFISVAFYFLTNLFYVMFISTRVQDWNDIKPTESVENGDDKEKAAKEKSRNNSTMEHKF